LMRWRRRRRQGLPLSQIPGPKKVGTPCLCDLEKEVRLLHPALKRTPGAGALYQKYAPVLSRREFAELIAKSRKECVKNERAQKSRIEWLVPGAVFALDETELLEWPGTERAFALCSLDLSSRYVFEARINLQVAHGENVAEFLREVFEVHGAPLFLKRDNGSNMNAACVNEVLEEYHVLPLNSPAYYCAYNGGVERVHQDVADALEKSLCRMGGIWTRENVQLHADLGIHELNHHQRRVLKGRTPCRVLHGENRRKYGKQERRVIYEWLKEKTAAILGSHPKNGLSFEAAYRAAAETWLKQQGIIRVHKPTKSVTPFSPEMVS
ncbi:MAG: hypothetical protein ACREH5_05645, partial [Candidatus Omnitrophota bacterium]